MNVIVEYQYFSPSILFKTLCKATHFVFEQYENFQKMTFRNRLMIAGGQGPLLLSIPLRKGRSQRSMTKEILIDYRTPWQGSHWKTIISCYNRSPWFEYYRDELNELYKTPYEFLTEWNFACLTWILTKMDFQITVSLTDQWKELYDPEKWVDWRNRLSPNSIQTSFPDAPRYNQVFMDRTGFIPHLSILDLLFCEGKNARIILCQQ